MEQRKSPWEILGIPENSADDVAKSAWKKLVIRCHPDKVADDLKAEKEEEFKLVNEAFKTITDPELRKAFDEAQEIRQRMREAGPPRFNSTPSRSYNTRTAAPPPTFTRSETWDYSRSYDDDRYYGEQRSSARKHEGYDSQSTPPKNTSRSHRSERERRVNDEKVTRSDRRRARDRDEKRDRQSKFAYIEEDSDERCQYEESYHRRSEEQRVRDRHADEGRRHDDEKKHTRSHSDKYDERTHKYYSQEDEALDYINRQRQRPESSRVFVRRGSAAPQEAFVRRSSARRDSGRTSGRDRDREHDRERPRTHRSSIEVVDFPSERKPPSFHHSSSSPAGIKVTRIPAQRSSSEYDRDDPLRPSFRRSETSPPMPHLNVPPSSSRRKDSIPPHGSKLRASESAVGEDSGYSSPTTPDANYHQVHTPVSAGGASTKYKYSTASGGVNRLDDDASTVTATPYEYSNGHRTVLREPESGSRRRNSPSPIRPGLTTTRTVPTTRYATASAGASPSTPRSASYAYTTTTVEPRSSDESMRPVRPNLRHASTTAAHHSVRRSPDREHSGLYREIVGEEREDILRSSRGHGKGGTGGSFTPEGVSFRKKFTSDDIKYGTGSYVRSGRDRGRDTDYVHPGMTRTPTYVQ